MKKQFFDKWAFPFLSVCFWIGVWWVAALILNKPLLLPTPWRVLCKLFSLVATASFWQAVGTSLLRIAGGILAALLLGTLLALATTGVRLLHHLFSPLLSLCKSTPVAAVIFLLMLFLGRQNVPFFITLTVATPIVWGNVRAGLGAVDLRLLEMGRVFGLSRSHMLLHVCLPMLRPYFRAACLSAIGLAFKAGIAAEILCLPAGSIGNLIYESKLYLHTEELFAYTLTVILISAAIERITLLLLKRAEQKREVYHA
ncbi:MAG: ABC transporter permease subunit [Ruminococcaceae bacterium]|nr:ABC transporter permease subunit [Oscillospiraceae bacterium]